jgi:DNA-binding helix-hairpin-helix protein with protein kinase domain
VIEKRGKALKAKIDAMIPLQANIKAKGIHASWPAMQVFNAQGEWIGYAMRRAEGQPMHKMAHARLYRQYFPTLDRRAVVGYLLDFVKQVQALHALAVFPGDYNLQNLFCTQNAHTVHFIDCDSHQVRVGGQLYPCPVGSADLTAPEQQGHNFETLVRTPESEAFSVAILLFKALMIGRHPYDIVGGEDTVTNIQRGQFAYGVGNRGIPRGPWYNIWSHMPHRMKTLFIQTFTEGSQKPSARATLKDWAEALTIYRREIDRGWHEVAICPSQPKSKDYRGKDDGKSAPCV